jgi:hypothetical protein
MASSSLSEANYLDQAIDKLKAHIKERHPNSSQVRVLKNVGEFAFVFKFDTFNEFDLNLTLQIPSTPFIASYF